MRLHFTFVLERDAATLTTVFTLMQTQARHDPSPVAAHARHAKRRLGSETGKANTWLCSDTRHMFSSQLKRESSWIKIMFYMLQIPVPFHSQLDWVEPRDPVAVRLRDRESGVRAGHGGVSFPPWRPTRGRVRRPASRDVSCRAAVLRLQSQEQCP